MIAEILLLSVVVGLCGTGNVANASALDTMIPIYETKRKWRTVRDGTIAHDKPSPDGALQYEDSTGQDMLRKSLREADAKRITHYPIGDQHQSHAKKVRMKKTFPTSNVKHKWRTVSNSVNDLNEKEGEESRAEKSWFTEPRRVETRRGVPMYYKHLDDRTYDSNEFKQISKDTPKRYDELKNKRNLNPRFRALSENPSSHSNLNYNQNKYGASLDKIPTFYGDLEDLQNAEDAYGYLDRPPTFYDNLDYQQDIEGDFMTLDGISPFYDNVEQAQPVNVSPRARDNIPPFYDDMTNNRIIEQKRNSRFQNEINKRGVPTIVQKFMHIPIKKKKCNNVQDGQLNYGSSVDGTNSPHDGEWDSNEGIYDSSEDRSSYSIGQHEEYKLNTRELASAKKREQFNPALIGDPATSVWWAFLFIFMICLGLFLFLFCFNTTHLVHEIIVFCVALFAVVWLLVYVIVPYRDNIK